MEIGGHTCHPATEIFPLMGERELAELADDIRSRGQLQAIVLHEGRLLDGRNRLLACQRAGVEPRFEEWSGEGSPTAWVLSMNLRRRHLDESQRALVAARAKTLFEEEARGRQLAGLKKGESPVQANLPERGQARDRAAELVNVSPRTVESASRVLRHGTPELVEAVESRKASVSAAAEVAELPAEHQREVVARGEDAILAAAKEIRGRKRAERVKQRKELAARLRAEPPAPPEGPFRVIVADPPWRYDTRVEEQDVRGLCAYPDMSVDEICALPVSRLAHQDAVLWLWTTNAFMHEAFHVLVVWGFVPKTILTWDKERMGVGHWLRNVTEHCILATRGKPVVELSDQTTLIREPRREHSRKPDAFYALVEALCPGSRVELFARESRPGWTAWGLERGKFDAA